MVRLILLTDFTESYAYNLLRGVLNYSKESAEPWVVCRMPYAYKLKYGIAGVLKWAKRWQANAIIAQFDNEDDVSLFKKEGIVAVAQDFKSRFTEIPNITSNYHMAGRMGADYFLRRGFENFAFCGYKHVVWSEERSDGFQGRLVELGLGHQFYEYKNQDLEDLWFYESDLMCRWLLSLPRPIAIMVCDDNQGNKLSEACRLCQLKIPEEVAILGVDNDDTVCNLSDPPLSSINMNIEHGGYEAAQLIHKAIKNPEESLSDIYVSATHIVSRLSTNIYATKDQDIALALKFIHANIHQNINVKNVLKEVPLSRRLLEIRFKKITKSSVYQYIFNLKMKLFTQLLLSSDKLISEIADEVGIVDCKNLSRQFKAIKGCTPTEYRRKNHINWKNISFH